MALITPEPFRDRAAARRPRSGGGACVNLDFYQALKQAHSPSVTPCVVPPPSAGRLGFDPVSAGGDATNAWPAGQSKTHLCVADIIRTLPKIKIRHTIKSMPYSCKKSVLYIRQLGNRGAENLRNSEQSFERRAEKAVWCFQL